MKLGKNSRVRFCVQGYDKWGITPKKKWFAFTLGDANIVEYQDSETYAFFNKAVEKNAIVDILIGRERVDVNRGIEIVRKEVEKYKDIKHPGGYEVNVRTITWGGVEDECIAKSDSGYKWLLYDTAEWAARRENLLRIITSCRHYYETIDLNRFSLWKQDVTTGEYIQCSDRMQTEFRDKLAEEWNRQKEEWIKNGKR